MHNYRALLQLATLCLISLNHLACSSSTVLEDACNHLAFCGGTGGEDIINSCVTSLEAELEADRANTEQICQDLAIFKEQYLACIAVSDCTSINNVTACPNEWAEVQNLVSLASDQGINQCSSQQ